MQFNHSTNKNLSIVYNGQYQNLSVYHKPLIEQYLSAIHRTFHAALHNHPRTFVVRFDLHLPLLNFDDSPNLYSSTVISKFFKSLTAKIKHDRRTKEKEGKRVHSCTLRYVWAKERAQACTDHYHVAIFLNNDAYSHLGNYNNLGRNLSTKIIEAWASALGIDEFVAKSLVHFPQEAPIYYINRNKAESLETYKNAFYRLSYLAKLETKHFGDKTRAFGYSQN